MIRCEISCAARWFIVCGHEFSLAEWNFEEKSPFVQVNYRSICREISSELSSEFSSKNHGNKERNSHISLALLLHNTVLSTVMAQAVSILNSRPLTQNSDSALDEQPLTPNHLLHLRPCQGLPPGIFDKDDLSCRRAWRQVQYLANLFWLRRTREYLPNLLERKKWNTLGRNLEIGNLVLLADKSFPRGKWPLGRVVEVMHSRDGLVCTVRVNTSCTVATRPKRQHKGEPLNKESMTVLTCPVTKLCLLELDWAV